MRNTIEMLFSPDAGRHTRQEWVKVGASAEQGGYDTYADTATLRRDGARAKMWHLHDFHTAQLSRDKAYLSAKNWVEYDLNNARRRTLYFSWNAGRMGAGETVWRMDEPSAWRPILPGSVAALLCDLAAGRAR